MVKNAADGGVRFLRARLHRNIANIAAKTMKRKLPTTPAAMTAACDDRTAASCGTGVDRAGTEGTALGNEDTDGERVPNG